MEDRLEQGAPADTVDVCAGCGQLLLTTPDDPMPTLWCGVCFEAQLRDGLGKSARTAGWLA
jgi:hypothetical protein